MSSGQSIGDLFVKLGFDVDDSKLKTFDASIKELFQGIARFAGVGAGIGGFITLANNAKETAVQIANLTTVYGANAQAIQAWGAAVHEANPLKSYAEGIASFGSIAEYMKNAAFTPQGANSLNRLGVQFRSDDVQNPERIIDKLFESIPKLLKEHPDQRGLYAQLVGEVTGDATNLRVFEKGKDFQSAAGARASLMQKELDDTVKVAQDIAALQNEWDKFYKHAFGTLAHGILDLDKNIKEKGFLAGVGYSLDQLGAADIYNLTENGKKLIDNPVMNMAVAATSKALQPGNIGESRQFWYDKGYNHPQVAAWMAQEEAESNFDPKADNKLGYKGLFQWSAKRRKAIKDGTGIDIDTASHYQQLQAADWEFRNMKLDQDFKKINKSRDASEFLSKKFEIHEKISNRGDEFEYRKKLAERNEKQVPPNVTYTQVIHSNADAQEVARIAADRHDRMILGVYRQQNGNP